MSLYSTSKNAVPLAYSCTSYTASRKLYITFTSIFPNNNYNLIQSVLPQDKSVKDKILENKVTTAKGVTQCRIVIDLKGTSLNNGSSRLQNYPFENFVAKFKIIFTDGTLYSHVENLSSLDICSFVKFDKSGKPSYYDIDPRILANITLDNSGYYDFSVAVEDSNIFKNFKDTSSTLTIRSKKDPFLNLLPFNSGTEALITMSTGSPTLVTASSDILNSYNTNYYYSNPGTSYKPLGPIETTGLFVPAQSSEQVVTFISSNSSHYIRITIVAINLEGVKGTDAYEPDSSSPTTTYAVCTDSTADNYYKSSPYPSCTEGNLSLAIVNSTNGDYVFSDGGCCIYSDSDTVNLTVSGEITAFPTPSNLTGGKITLNWSGGKSPYDLAFTCAATDGNCATRDTAGDYDLTNTTSTRKVIELLNGTTVDTYSYAFTITDADNKTTSGFINGLLSSSSAATLNCKTSSAINYVNTGTTENSVCRWCDAATGYLTDADEVIDGDIYDETNYGRHSRTTEEHNVFTDFNTIESNATTTGGTDGQITYSWGWDSLSVSIGSNDYNFNFGDSSEVSDGGGTLTFRIEWKKYTSNDVLSDTNSSLRKNRFNGSTHVATAVVNTSNATTYTKTIESLGAGHYLAKLSYSDDNDTHEIEQCYYIFPPVTIKEPGCTEDLATNTATNVALTYESTPSSCLYSTDINLPTILAQYFDFQYTLGTSSTNPCSFTVQPQWRFVPGTFTNSTVEQYQNFSDFSNYPSAFYNTLLQVVSSEFGYTSGQIAPGLDIDIESINFTRTYSTTNGEAIQLQTDDAIASGSSGSGSYLVQGNGDSFQTQFTINFGQESNTISAQVGPTNIELDLSVSYIGNVLGTASIDFLEPQFNLISIIEVAAAGNVIDSVTGDALCADCSAATESQIQGCTDPIACNYNADANIDDGSCATIPGATFGGGIVQVTTDEGETLVGIPCSCNNEDYTNADPLAVWFWQNYPPPANSIAGQLGYYNFTTSQYATSVGQDPCTGIYVSGCTDPSASNYNPDANEDDGTCTYPTLGCTDNTACNYQPLADEDDGSCITDWQDLNIAEYADFNNWSYSTATLPTICTGPDAGANGSLTISNASYDGPFSFGFSNNNEFPVTNTGYQEYSWNFENGLVTAPAFTVINTIASSISQGGYATTVSLTGGAGSTIIISNIPSGAYNFWIVPYATSNLTTGLNGETNFANIECWPVILNIANNTGLSQISYVTGDGYSDGTTTDTWNNTNIYTNSIYIGAEGSRRVRAAANCGCADPNYDNYDSTIDILDHDPNLCLNYGCTDPEASNYDPTANFECTDSENQYSCQSCVYGYADTLYTPQFCMPKKIELQLDTIKRCIGTAGTNSYISMITGKNDCAFNDSWKLILIEYLLSKKGLDCIYNCQDSSTPNLEELESCDVRSGILELTGDLSSGLTGSNTRIFRIGDTIKYRSNALVDYQYYTLRNTPNNVLVVTVSIASPILTFSPEAWNGWQFCEEPPIKVTNRNYIQKFLNFVQNYCRQCQLPSESTLPATPSVGSVITVNGVVITVNNSNLE